MDSRFYVSLEAARLLKEKGYDRECVAYYQHGTFYPYAINTQRELSITNKNATLAYMEQYSAPTKAEAIDWLESKGIYIDLLYTLDGKWDCAITIPSRGIIIDDIELSNTRLEAEEAAIIKALELL